MAVAEGEIRRSTALGMPMGWPRVLWVTGTVLFVTMVVHIAALVITPVPFRDQCRCASLQPLPRRAG